MKICGKCHKEKPLDQFRPHRRVGKKPGYQSYCIECMRTNSLERYYKNPNKQRDISRRNYEEKAKWLADLKKTLSCERCPQNHPATLDFHHRDPNQKDFAVGTLLSRGRSIDNIKKEIAKCDVLCSNCHRIHHWNSKMEAQERL